MKTLLMLPDLFGKENGGGKKWSVRSRVQSKRVRWGGKVREGHCRLRRNRRQPRENWERRGNGSRRTLGGDPQRGGGGGVAGKTESTTALGRGPGHIAEQHQRGKKRSKRVGGGERSGSCLRVLKDSESAHRLNHGEEEKKKSTRRGASAQGRGKAIGRGANQQAVPSSRLTKILQQLD